MKSLGAFLVVSCVAFVGACSGDSFQPAQASAGAGGGLSTGGTTSSAGQGSGAGGGQPGAGSAGASGGEAGAGGVAGGGAAAAGGSEGGEGGEGGQGGGGGSATGTGGAQAGGGEAGAGGAKPGGAGGTQPGGAGGAKPGGAGGKAGAAGGSAGAAGGSTGAPYSVSNHDAVGELGPGGEKHDVSAPAVFDTDMCEGTNTVASCGTTAVKAGRSYCVCRVAGDLTLMKGANFTGSRAMVLLVTGNVELHGVMRVLSGTAAAATGPSPGPAGGSFGSLGGGAAPDPLPGNAMLVPLLPGQSGQDGGSQKGGRGGGAVQISASGTLTVANDCVIDAGGQGGEASAAASPGPAAGSGGAILLEAEHVQIAGALVANGGSGAGGGSKDGGKPGAAGSQNVAPVAGGAGATDACLLNKSVTGGKGGQGAAKDAEASAGDPPSPAAECAAGGTIQAASGGGGGGRGRIRIRYRSLESSGIVSPAPSTEPLPPP